MKASMQQTRRSLQRCSIVVGTAQERTLVPSWLVELEKRLHTRTPHANSDWC